MSTPQPDKKTRARGGQIYELGGGPHKGLRLRLGINLPNGTTVPLPEQIGFPDVDGFYVRREGRDKKGEFQWVYEWGG